jgi:hypothetical protein
VGELLCCGLYIQPKELGARSSATKRSMELVAVTGIRPENGLALPMKRVKSA